MHERFSRRNGADDAIGEAGGKVMTLLGGGCYGEYAALDERPATSDPVLTSHDVHLPIFTTL